jgi:CRP-like cAMP-binding protein
LNRQHFAAGQVLAAPGACEHCHFVLKGLASIRYGGDSVGVGLVGPGAILNIGSILGAGALTHSVIALTECDTFQMEAQALQAVCHRNPQLERSIAHYLHARLNQTMAVAACHIRHPLDQRLCSWIGAAGVMLDAMEIRVTHRQLALLLGVQRSSVTVALETLEGRQLIWSKRNRILIRDRRKLAANACGCLAPLAPFFQPQSAGECHAQNVGHSTHDTPAEPAVSAFHFGV